VKYSQGCFGGTTTNPNYSPDYIEITQNQGKAFYYSLQNLVSYLVLQENLNFKIYEITAVLFILYETVKLGLSQSVKK
jgi:hypothetical protein